MTAHHPTSDKPRGVQQDPRRRRGRRLPPLSWPTRLILLGLGWILVTVGVAGLVLPGIQGILTIVLGVAILSLGSETIHGWLRRVFQRWPRGWRRVERMRNRIHRWLRG